MISAQSIACLDKTKTHRQSGGIQDKREEGPHLSRLAGTLNPKGSSGMVNSVSGTSAYAGRVAPIHNIVMCSPTPRNQTSCMRIGSRNEWP